VSGEHEARRTHCVVLFDLDGTLTWRDTLLPFLMGYLSRRPGRWLGLWRLPAAVLRYATQGRDRGLLKSRIIRLVMGGDTRRSVDAWAEHFVGSLKRRGTFRSAALTVLEEHRRAGDHLVLLSASPDLYVPRIGALLGFERTLCTEVAWRDNAGEACLDGTLITANRRGEEKCRCLAWLRTQYPDLPVVAYGNSDSDLPHLRQADRALLVNGNSAARRAATAAGIPVGDWR
jgi:phosphatidylglycerophosphatase C